MYNPETLPSFQLFKSLTKYSDLEQLINDGRCEDLYFECKEQQSPDRVSPEVIAKTLSAFSNTSGGVVIWGAHTDKKAGRDMLTELYPIGKVDELKNNIGRKIPTLTMPSISNVILKAIKKKKTDTRGILVGWIPPRPYEPTRSLTDNHFYIRTDDDSTIASYEFIQRMFNAQSSPDLSIDIEDISYSTKNSGYELPIVVSNNSTSAARDAIIMMKIVNADSMKSVAARNGLQDISSINNGQKVYRSTPNTPVYKNLKVLIGILKIEPKDRSKRIELNISAYCDRMHAKKITTIIHLHKNNPRVFSKKEEFIS